MGTKMALAFANVFMVNIEKEIHRQSTYKPLVWKRFIDENIRRRQQQPSQASTADVPAKLNSRQLRRLAA